MKHRPDRPVVEVFDVVRDTDPDVLDSDGVAGLLAEIAVLRAWCDARQVRAVRRQRCLAAEGRGGDPRGSLASHGRQSAKDARAAAERESVCTSMPGFEDALAGGAVSAGHVDAIAAATRNLDDAATANFVAESESLLGDAERQDVDTFAKNCKSLAAFIRNQRNENADVDELEQQRQASKVSRWTDTETGMRKTLIELDPISDRELWSAVQHHRGRLRARTNNRDCSWERLTVDALLAAVATGNSGPTGSSGGGQRVASLVVHVDANTVTGGRHTDTLCETDSGVPVPVATMRRLACDAGILPVVLNGDGVVLDEGRTKRLATREQRRAIEAMHTTCAHADCTVTVDECRIHHLEPWSRGGRTDLAELVPVCETHHHLVHEGGWTLTMTPDRIGTWTRPDGILHWTGPLLDRNRPEQGGRFLQFAS